jgi:hypothetical protein
MQSSILTINLASETKDRTAQLAGIGCALGTQHNLTATTGRKSQPLTGAGAFSTRVQGIGSNVFLST